MDSFFAAVEQQANPSLRGKPIAVSGKEGSRTVIVASSREAKFFGIKTAMLQHEARRLCPKLIFVQPDGLKYSFLHKQFMEIFKRFTDTVEVFSIDEAFLDLTGLVSSWSEAKVVAMKIKELIKRDLGEWVTCSVGIGKNKLIAKLASDLNKPNGLVVVNEQNWKFVFSKTKLTDFCGIGRATKSKLDGLGVDSVDKLREYPKSNLIKEFGSHGGTFLYNLARGIDFSPVVSDSVEEEIKSISRAYTLPQDCYNKEEIYSVMLHLCEKVGRALRRKKLAGKTVVVYLRYSDFMQSGFRQTLPGYINDSLKLFSFGRNHLEKVRLQKGVRLVGVCVTNLVQDYKQQSLWEKDRKLDDIVKSLDKINDTYGELTIKPAYLLKLKRLRNKVGGFKVKE
jgi:DNA polymerase IV